MLGAVGAVREVGRGGVVVCAAAGVVAAGLRTVEKKVWAFGLCCGFGVGGGGILGVERVVERVVMCRCGGDAII